MDQLISWLVIILVFGGLFFVGASIILWSLRNGISPMPTSYKAKRCLLTVLPLQVKGKVYELGAGWGTLLFPLAKRYPECQVIGYETSLLPYWFSRARCLLGGYSNVALIRRDFFQLPLSDAGLVVCYLYPAAMQRLKEKFVKDLQPGTWVVSNTFSIAGWQPLTICPVDDLYYTKIYVYRMHIQENSK